MRTFLICIAAIIFLSACKPTESGYRRAYERTIEAKGEELADGYSAIAGRVELQMQKIMVGRDTLPCAFAFVAVTPGIGNPPSELGPYCAAAGCFRQRFTAADMCQRLIDSGYGQAFVAQTGTPRYCVVAKSCEDAAEAASIVKSLPGGKGFILRPTKR